MAKFVAITKAARLLGIKRVELQQLIRKGELVTFEGLVDIEALKLRFPAIAWGQSSIVERTQIIRDNAYARRLQDHASISKDTLESQLRRLQVELAVHKTTEDLYRQIIVDLMDKLNQLQQLDSHKQLAEELNSWLLQQFQHNSPYT